MKIIFTSDKLCWFGLTDNVLKLMMPRAGAGRKKEKGFTGCCWNTARESFDRLHEQKHVEFAKSL